MSLMRYVCVTLPRTSVTPLSSSYLLSFLLTICFQLYLSSYFRQHESIGFDLYSDVETITVPPGGIQLIPTGIAAKCPSGSSLRIAPRSGLTVKRSLHTLAGVVDPDYTGNITVVMHNFGLKQKEVMKISRQTGGNVTLNFQEILSRRHSTYRKSSITILVRKHGTAPG